MSALSRVALPKTDALLYDVRQVLKILAEHRNEIEGCKGKTVVGVFGLQQVGKSTTINALTLGPLRKVTASGETVFIPVGKTVKREVAESGSGRVGCTKTPNVYPIDDEMVLLDTRGFFDERNPNEMVAATLLTEMALKQAKCVKLIFLQRVASVLKGGVGMRDFGVAFGKLVKNEDIPAIFVFNNCPANPAFRKKGEILQDAVLRCLKEEWNSYWVQHEKEKEQYMLRIISRLRSTMTGDVANLFERYSDKDLWRMMNEKKLINSINRISSSLEC